MKIGFTGTRWGMTDPQKKSVQQLLSRLRSRSELHHGDCIGADREVHDYVLPRGVQVYRHPPTDSTHRAYCKGGAELPPKPYLRRNRDIVDATDLLVAAPDGPERLRSGTWSTIRYAISKGRPLLVVLTDGKVVAGVKALRGDS